MNKDSQFKTKHKIQIYTDGSCLGNPGPGGWACLLIYLNNGKTYDKLISGKICSKTTNNVAELTAIYNGLKALKKKDIPVEIYTDSQYSQNALTEYRESWEYRDFKGVKNIELIKSLYELVDSFKNISIIYVKAHNGHEHNEKVDKEARRQASLC